MHITTVIKLTDAAVWQTISLKSLAERLLKAGRPSTMLIVPPAERQTTDELLAALQALNVPCFLLEPPAIDLVEKDLLREQITKAALESCGGPAIPIISEEQINLEQTEKDRYVGHLAAVLGATEIQLWSRTAGFFTADPKIVEQAFTIPELSYDEALELGHTGARALCPPLLTPARDAAIPIRIVSAANPDAENTLIRSFSGQREFPLTGLFSVSEVALLRIEGAGLLDSIGMSERAFRSLAEAQISVQFISQTASEHSISIAVAADSGQSAKQALQKEFAAECEAHDLEAVQAEDDCSVVSAVGEGMCGRPGVSGKLFQALGQNGINIRAIAQGSSERNVSVVIAKRDEAKALNVLHDALFLSPVKTVHLFVVGTGQVGSTFLQQIQDQHEILAERRVQLRVVCLANSRQMLFDESGIDLTEWPDLLSMRGTETQLDQLVERIENLNLSNSIFVDCTASEEIAGTYEGLLTRSISIVTPNKKAHSGHSEQYQALKELASRADVKFYYEATVGAGLPVIGTLHDLLVSGDEVRRVEAVLSGTLSYLFNSFTGELPFSEIVSQARDCGYTEPDPRDDLSGTDVARKLLILSREIGWPLELGAIDVESLVPKHCEGAASVEEFLEQLKNSDAEFESRRAQAEADGCVLRYIGSLTDGRAAVSLQAVSQEHPFYQLSGSDNIIAFSTKRYSERPLVVKGPGAGTDVTAAGVLADVLRVVSYLE